MSERDPQQIHMAAELLHLTDEQLNEVLDVQARVGVAPNFLSHIVRAMDAPLEDLPLYLGDRVPIVQAIAEMRLEVGR